MLHYKQRAGNRQANKLTCKRLSLVRKMNGSQRNALSLKQLYDISKQIDQQRNQINFKAKDAKRTVLVDCQSEKNISLNELLQELNECNNNLDEDLPAHKELSLSKYVAIKNCFNNLSLEYDQAEHMKNILSVRNYLQKKTIARPQSKKQRKERPSTGLHSTRLKPRPASHNVCQPAQTQSRMRPVTAGIQLAQKESECCLTYNPNILMSEINSNIQEFKTTCKILPRTYIDKKYAQKREAPPIRLRMTAKRPISKETGHSKTKVEDLQFIKQYNQAQELMEASFSQLEDLI